MVFRWRPYVSVRERRHRAAQEMARLQKKGHRVSPVVIRGRTIAATFWGKAWCENLERYSDFANRLPRGRTYIRNGSVCDLQIAPGEAKAVVSGSELYKVAVRVKPVPKARWTAICRDCAGAIDSLVELLQGRFSKGVMERICQQRTGLFPSPAEIEMTCSCPDWATMCKHVAAVLYGVGARLDAAPELLFKLRKVDERQLIARAGKRLPLSAKAPATERVLGDEGLSELFGIEMAKAAPARRKRLATPSRPGPAASPAPATGKAARAASARPAPEPASGKARGPKGQTRRIGRALRVHPAVR
jgi:uncharacterized Zn finger protein